MKAQDRQYTKVFAVAAISTNANSFGLHSVIFVARDGTALEGLKTGQFLPKRGSLVDLRSEDHLGALSRLEYECPRELPEAPQAVVDEAWKGFPLQCSDPLCTHAGVHEAHASPAITRRTRAPQVCTDPSCMDDSDHVEHG